MNGDKFEVALIMTDSRDEKQVDESYEDARNPVRQLIQRVRAAALQSSTLKLAEETPLDPFNQPLALADTDPGCTEKGSLASFETFDSLPKSIGRFQIQETIGRGGFGLVLLANDPQLNRQVALKIPKFDTMVSANGRNRFMREARAAALLGHPNIVSVYEAGQAGPVMYIAFEYIEGESLSHWIKSNNETKRWVDHRQIGRLMAALAAGVQHAHQRGIIHRDLKPANVLLQDTSAAELEPAELAVRARIADFGLAHIHASDSLETQTGSLMGTPMYVAPEQLRVSADSVSPAVDVYGLGAIMYELLTGQPPFSGPSLPAIVKAVECELPVAPSQLDRNIPLDLEAVCLKCLEKQPSKRYANAADLQDDIDRWLDGRPVKARRWTRRERAWRWLVQNRTVASLVTTILVALAAGMATAIWQANQNRELFRISEQHRLDAIANLHASQTQKQRAEGHLDRAESAIDQMLNQVAVELASIPGMAKLRNSLLTKALEFERELVAIEGNDPDVLLRAAKAQGRIGEIELMFGRLTDALKSFNAAIAMAEVVAPEHETQAEFQRQILATIKMFIARVYAQQGKFEDIEQVVAPIVSEYSELNADELTPIQLRTFGDALSLLARSQLRQSRFDEAEQTNLSEALVRSTIPADDLTMGDRQALAATWGSMANIYRSTGDLTKAADSYQKSIEEFEELLTEEPHLPRVRATQLISFCNLAACLIEDLKDMHRNTTGIPE
jgi:tRNA A-37 threonylcarbamoyl transferase component Bud32/tetratricopeptide (TPR) repeat protein